MAGTPAMNPWRGVPIALLGAAVGFLLSLVGLFAPAERLFHDARLLLRDPEPADSGVHVLLAEPASRAEYGGLVAAHAGATAIGIDVLFLETRPDDAELAAALSAARNVVLATRFAAGLTEQEDPGRVDWLLPDSAPLPERRRRIREYSSVFAPDEILGRASAAAGHVNVTVDPDGKVRRIPLLIAHEGRLFPSLALSLCLLANGREPADLRLGRRSIEFDDRDGNTVRVPVDRDWRMLVGYDRGLGQFAESRAPVEGRVVLMGRTGGTGNLRSTPLWPAVEGVYVHAAALDDLLSGRFNRRPGRPWELLEVILFAVATGLLLVRLRPWPSVAAALLLCVAPFVVGHFAFLQWGWMLPVAGPMVAIACGAAMMAVARLLERRERRRRTARIFLDGLPETTLRLLDAGPLGGVTRREVSLLVLRLTGLEAEGIGAKDAAEALRRFFEAVRREVLNRDGALIELSAERAVALFNAPLPVENHAQAATEVACALRATIRESVLDRYEGAAAPLGLAGALHLGAVNHGVVGTRGHERFVVFGEPLREAGALLVQAGSDRTLVSRTFAERVGERYETVAVDADSGVRMLLGPGPGS